MGIFTRCYGFLYLFGLFRLFVLLFGKLFAGINFFGAAPYFGLLFLGEFGHFEGESHIVGNGHVRIERIVLENHGGIAQFAVDIVYDDVVYFKFARGNLLEPRNHAQHRRLAAAGGADEHDELLVVNLHREVVHRLGAVWINFINIL